MSSSPLPTSWSEKREKKLASVATSPSTRSISSPGVWLLWNVGVQRQQVAGQVGAQLVGRLQPHVLGHIGFGHAHALGQQRHDQEKDRQR